jgi:L-rhamnose mutarotase
MDRVFFLMRIKEGHENDYIRRHQNVWPEVLAEHRRAGVKKMAIYMQGTKLFLYMEAENYSRAARILSSSPVVLRWEESMAPIMESSDGKSFDPANAYPDGLPEVFFWECADQTNESRDLQVGAAASQAPPAPHAFGARSTQVR